jgi:fructose-bisphosphate aldolase, class I
MEIVGTEELENIVQRVMMPREGILAADASTSTLNKRLAAVSASEDEETRRRYRELLFTTPKIEEGISAVILYDETIRQKSSDGVPFAQLLSDKNIVPGIKVDMGKVTLPRFPNEQITEGLDGLSDRIDEYKEMGAQFAKWRAVIHIGEGLPTDGAIDANMHVLARYAGICQSSGIVPIVEPEVLMDGDHTIEVHEEVTRRVYSSLFKELKKYRVELSGIILKTAMVLAGKECVKRADAHAVAEYTARTLQDFVPKEIGGVVFLSGGQRPEEATENLNEIMKEGSYPFPLSFSFARALQEPALKAWAGKDENRDKAQKIFWHRIVMDTAALKGEWSTELEAEPISRVLSGPDKV